MHYKDSVVKWYQINDNIPSNHLLKPLITITPKKPKPLKQTTTNNHNKPFKLKPIIPIIACLFEEDFERNNRPKVQSPHFHLSGDSKHKTDRSHYNTLHSFVPSLSAQPPRYKLSKTRDSKRNNNVTFQFMVRENSIYKPSYWYHNNFSTNIDRPITSITKQKPKIPKLCWHQLKNRDIEIEGNTPRSLQNETQQTNEYQQINRKSAEVIQNNNNDKSIIIDIQSDYDKKNNAESNKNNHQNKKAEISKHTNYEIFDFSHLTLESSNDNTKSEQNRTKISKKSKNSPKTVGIRKLNTKKAQKKLKAGMNVIIETLKIEQEMNEEKSTSIEKAVALMLTKMTRDRYLFFLKCESILGKEIVEKLVEIYHLIDLNNDGNLTIDEVVKFNIFLDPYGTISTVNTDARLLFCIADEDQNSAITEMEWLNGWVKTAQSVQNTQFITTFIEQYQNRQIKKINVITLLQFTAKVLKQILMRTRKYKSATK